MTPTDTGQGGGGVEVRRGGGGGRRGPPPSAGEPVERAVLERIALTAQRAPSAGFSQGQRLVVVTDPYRRRRVAEICGESYYVAEGFDPWISQAPGPFVPCVRG